MDNGFLIGRVLGIDIRINWSVLGIAALLSWSLAEGVLPEFAEGYTTGEYWAAGVVTAVAFLASLLAHELGHSVVAQQEGVGVVSISLWLLGGLARLDAEPKSPRAAMRIAIAGPVVSVALGAIGLGLSLAVPGLGGAALTWFGAINIALAAFNLLPAFPMDGGRVYRAWQWERSGDEIAATQRAAGLGRAIGTALIALGIIEVFALGAVGGIWMVLVGWFVREAAAAELHAVVVGGPLRTVGVREVMSPELQCIEANESVDAFAAGLLHGGRHASYPVLDVRGRPVGLLSLNAVRALPRDRWGSTTVAQIATPLDQLLVVESSASVAELLDAMATRRDQRALVVDGGQLQGIISPSDVVRLVTVIETVGGDALLGIGRNDR